MSASKQKKLSHEYITKYIINKVCIYLKKNDKALYVKKNNDILINFQNALKLEKSYNKKCVYDVLVA